MSNPNPIPKEKSFVCQRQENREKSPRRNQSLATIHKIIAVIPIAPSTWMRVRYGISGSCFFCSTTGVQVDGGVGESVSAGVGECGSEGVGEWG